jgi:triphosphoribosyl-dephospho-CoA synthase
VNASAHRSSINAAPAQRLLTPELIGRAATLALRDELVLSPKPGLVTLSSTGSHTDMDAHTFMRSLLALRGYFVKIAQLGGTLAPFAALERCGIEAEARMLAATGGVNTHRGAVFQLGLLCAAAGAVSCAGEAVTATGIRAALIKHWGSALHARAARPSILPGGIAAHRLGLRSASQEAAAGFPVVFEIAAPALRTALDRGLTPPLAQLDALFHIIAVLDDSNLAHRGGAEGLAFAQQAARSWLARGGVAQPGGMEHAIRIGEAFVARRLSPGGAADMLASCCWLRRIGALQAA